VAVVELSLRPWAAGDEPLLRALVGDPAMMEHLGGPESDAKVAERQRRYEADPNQLAIVVDGEGAGWVGFWEREWRDERVYEIGWSVLPAFQGRGIATAATRLALERVRASGGPRSVCAYPAVDNGPSNAICRKLGFTLVGATEYEYPPGHPLRCNDWQLDLRLA
jgi:RimJ/RimL family protein N-acetyltransferase